MYSFNTHHLIVKYNMVKYLVVIQSSNSISEYQFFCKECKINDYGSFKI